MKYLMPTGSICFGVAVTASGLMQLVNGAPVRLVDNLPPWLGPTPSVAAATGVMLLLLGGAMLGGYRAKDAALLFGALLLAAFAVKCIPDILSNPRAGFMWTNPAKVLALFGGALVLGGRAERWPWLAPALLGIFLLICGVQHVIYAGFVDGLVPAWIPPGQRFWTLFSAGALLAGGLGVIVPRTRRLAGWWTGVMIFLWVLLLHVPRAVEFKNAFELAGVFEALALVGTAWLVAAAAPSTQSESR